MRTILFGILFFVGCFSVSSQTNPDSSSFFYQSKPVEIVEGKTHVRTSLSDQSFDLSTVSEYQTQDLATYLDRRGIAQININGAPGSAAAIRFRGTSSDHTTLFWNGFALNSVSLGSADLSMVPLFFMDRATLVSSPGATRLPGSNIGAGVDLNSSGIDADNPAIRLIGSYNSLNNSFTGIDLPIVLLRSKELSPSAMFVSGKNHTLLMRTRIFDQHIQNDFQYIDSYQFEKPRVNQRHNNGRAFGALNEVVFHTGAHRFEINSWYQKKDMNLPAIMGMNADGSAEQWDQIFRNSLGYKFTGENWRLGISAAYFDDVSKYRDHLLNNGEWAIHSVIRSRGLLQRAEVSGSSGNFSYSMDVLSNYYEVQNVNYVNGEISNHRLQSGASLQYKLKSRHIWTAGLRYDFGERNSEPAYSLNYKILRKSNSGIPLIEVQAAKSFRNADFNERYWFPSGNPDLKPESGLNYLMVFGIQLKTGKWLFTSKPSAFYSDIHDWIQWIPQTGSIWAPVNFKRVRSRGAEIPVVISGEFSGLHLQSELRYSYTDSRGVNSATWNNETDFVMVYSPAHVMFFEVMLDYKNLKIAVNNKYTSSRFTDETNLMIRALAPYHLTGASVSWLMEMNRSELELRVSADNLMDVSYESVRAYAMPGRVIQLTANYRFATNKKK